MTNELGPALAEAIGDGISEVRTLGRQRDAEPEPEIEEILGPEEFEALLLEGAASFEPSTPAATTPANSVRPTHATPQDLRSSGTWPKLHPETADAMDAASTLQVFPVDANEQRTIRIEPPNARPKRDPLPPAIVPNTSEPSQELAALRAELTRFSRQMRARDAYLQELELALEHNRRELATAGLSTGLTAARLFGRLRGQAFRIAELETDLRQAQLALATLRAAHQHSPSASPRDDLRAIRGIGPRFAEQLHELGFTSFASIATLSSDDMVRIATRLRISSDRIERDTWVEQARALVARSNP
jgi:predicted flap endonuclease-1-like 5' DNA nuclease